MHFKTKKNSSWFIVRATSILTLILFVSSPLSLQAQSASNEKKPIRKPSVASTSDRAATDGSTEDPEHATKRDNATRQLQSKMLAAALNAERKQDFRKAVDSITSAMTAGLKDPIVFYKRGCWNFRLGKIDASMNDFDRYVKLVPERANSQWERGITCYYANKFKAGAQQFVDYQTYHNQDVENAVWRYLCQVQFDGEEKSRKAILPIEGDRRIPMMEIYRLFRGESNPQKVLDVLAASTSSGLLGKHEKFDAHLYLALYFDVEGDLPKAKKHIELAVKQFKQGDYMWAVAVEHKNHIARKIEESKQQKGDELKGEQKRQAGDVEE